MPKSKYGAQRTSGFASKLEAAVYQILYLRMKAGEIDDIACQVQVELSAAKIVYKPDFRFLDIETGDIQYAEAKGMETPEWRIKRRLWIAYGPGRLEIWTGHHLRPSLKETIGSF